MIGRTKGDRAHDVNIPWLHKPEYMLSEKLVAVRCWPSAPATHCIAGHSSGPEDRRARLRLTVINAGHSHAQTAVTNKKDKDGQIQAIERTFAEARATPVHPSKPHLQPVEVLPVLPDFDVRCLSPCLNR